MSKSSRKRGEKKTLLVVVRDVTPTRIILKMLPHLKETWEVLFQVEGPAAERLAELGIPFEGHERNLPFSVLLLGCSMNSPLEREALLRAKQLEKPIIGIADAIGAHLRHNGTLAGKYLASSQLVADSLPDGLVLAVIGDINVAALPGPTAAMRLKVREWAGDAKVIVWAAQLSAEPLVTIEKCLRSGQKVILGLHPDPTKWPDADEIGVVRKRLGPERAEDTSSLCVGMNTLQALACFDPEQAILATSYSGAGSAAAAAGYRVAVFDGPDMRKLGKEKDRLPDGQLPLAEQIGSPVVYAGECSDVFKLSYPKQEAVRRVLRPLDPVSAAKSLGG